MYSPLCNNRSALAEWDAMHEAGERRQAAIDAEFLTLIDDPEWIEDAIREQADLIAIELRRLPRRPNTADEASFSLAVRVIVNNYLMNCAERNVDKGR